MDVSCESSLIHKTYAQVLWFQRQKLLIEFHINVDIPLLGSTKIKSSKSVSSATLVDRLKLYLLLCMCSFVVDFMKTVTFCRTIANMDLKLDFVRPSLINFISRQLVGNGFRLYQKVIYFSLFLFCSQFIWLFKSSLQ